jgi:hypothetical protein
MTRKSLVVVAGLVVGLLVDLLVHADIPGYGVGIGVLGTFVLTYGSQALAALVKRPADYYERVDLPPPQGGDG